MSNKPSIDTQDFAHILQRIQVVRGEVFQQVNSALMALYWEVGKVISQKVHAEAWGKGVAGTIHCPN